MARLLDRGGNLICRLKAVDFDGGVAEAATPFSAIVSDDSGVVIRRGKVLVELDDGSRRPAEIDHAEAIPAPHGPVVKITGVLGRAGDDESK